MEERTRTEEPSNGPIPVALDSLSITLRIVMNSEEPPRFTGHGTFVFLPTANLLYVSFRQLATRPVALYNAMSLIEQKRSGSGAALLRN